MAVSSDGTSGNQAKEQMHKDIKHSTVTNHGEKNKDKDKKCFAENGCFFC